MIYIDHLALRAKIGNPKSPRHFGLIFLSVLTLLFLQQSAFAQTVNTYSVIDPTPGGAITDLSCNQPTSAQIVRTFAVGSSYIVGDVDIGILATHSYRSDFRMFLTSPAGTTVNFITFTGNVQSGDNWNDLFDDEAATAVGSHNANVTDPGTPIYSHSFQPVNPLSAFDGQNASGTWTLRICDGVASDIGNFLRADLYITSTSLSVSKSSSVISDGVSTSNPKALPTAVVQYCLLTTNNGKTTAPNATVNQTAIAASDPIPSNATYVPGSLLSGTSCAGATTAEDDNNIGSDESDPFGAWVNGTTINGSAASLAPGASFALVYRVTIN
jgi:uncharacterized repeat protein (TIGR01451 family)